jgi:hypothetical protein
MELNKLKTIRDLEIFALNPKDDLYEYEQGKQFAKSWVKQIAIEWIKELRTELETAMDLKLFETAQSDYIRMQILSVREEHPAQIEWIKHFFNITDDELYR